MLYVCVHSPPAARTFLPADTASPQPAGRFPRMVPGRRTVHGGPVQDRRQQAVGTGAHDSQGGRQTLLDKLTSKFSTKRLAFYLFET